MRRFDEPQKYKPFISRCVVEGKKLEIGTIREVDLKSGLPATKSTEILEFLDDNEHILGIRIVGGDHRLKVNWRFLLLFFRQDYCLKKKKTKFNMFFIQSELFFNHFVAFGDDRRENRDIGHRIVRGGCAGR